MAKILVVDDDEGIVDALTLILETSGYQVQTSLKRNEVIKKILHWKPDLILLDLLMSGLDGSEVCRKVRQTSEIKNIPIIMISAHPSAKVKALESGANEFIAKPFEITELLQKVEQYTQ